MKLVDAKAKPWHDGRESGFEDPKKGGAAIHGDGVGSRRSARF
jgi:hypothetical protein